MEELGADAKCRWVDGESLALLAPGTGRNHQYQQNGSYLVLETLLIPEKEK